jgi:hypothetical protein
MLKSTNHSFFGFEFKRNNLKKNLIIFYFILLFVFWIINTNLLYNKHLIYNTAPIVNNDYDTTPKIGKDSYVILDGLYYTIVSQTSTGYGDITPATPLAKIIISLHLMITYTLILIGSLVLE